jgi:hypothetical protein
MKQAANRAIGLLKVWVYIGKEKRTARQPTVNS